MALPVGRSLRYVVTENKKIDQRVDKRQIVLSSVSAVCWLDCNWNFQRSIPLLHKFVHPAFPASFSRYTKRDCPFYMFYWKTS